jgi:SAM-dependent methyltransferase
MRKKIEKFFFRCPICGSREFDTIYGVSVFNVCVCVVCGLVCLNPRMDERGYMEKVYKNYRKDLFGDYLADDVDAKELYGKPIESPSAKKVFNDLRGYLPNEAEILEIGCGAGEALIVFRQDGFRNITGLEPDSGGGSRKALKEFYDIECHITSFSEFIQENNGKKKFDCVILDQVIEHFVEPDKDVKRIHSIMAKGGLLYIATPDFYKFDRPFSQFAIPHTFYYSRATVETLLKKFGFRVEKYFDSVLPFSMTLLARKEEEIKPAAYDRGEYGRVLAYLKKNTILFILFKLKRFIENVFIKIFGESAYLQVRVFFKNFAITMIKKYRR